MCNRCYLMGLDDAETTMAHNCADLIAAQHGSDCDALGKVLGLLKLLPPKPAVDFPVITQLEYAQPGKIYVIPDRAHK